MKEVCFKAMNNGVEIKIENQILDSDETQSTDLDTGNCVWFLKTRNTGLVLVLLRSGKNKFSPKIELRNLVNQS